MVKRVFIGALAVLLIAGSSALCLGSWWLWSVFVAGLGAVSPLGTIRASEPAVLIDITSVSVTPPFGIEGSTDLVVDGSAGPVTILAGSTAQADEYLAGSPYAVASRTPGGWTTSSVPGFRELSDPALSDLATRATGDPAAIDALGIAPGSIVIISPPDMAQDLRIALRYRVPDARLEAIAAAAIGGYLLLVGITLLWAAVMGLRRRRGRA